MVAPADPCLSPTKGELVYSKTAKQCLEEISGNAGQHICCVLFEFNLHLLLSFCFGAVLTCCSTCERTTLALFLAKSSLHALIFHEEMLI